MTAPDRPYLPLEYAEARRLILNGDIALCRQSSLEGAVIARETGSEYVHATMLGWLGDGDPANHVLLIGETLQHVGSHLVPLSGVVEEWPGLYDVYRVRWPGYARNAAWAFMARAANRRYGWRHNTRVWARRHIGRIVPPIPNSDLPAYERNCSALVHAALRNSRGPRLAIYDCDVVPGHLSMAKYFEYVCTLFAHRDQFGIGRDAR